MSDEIQGDLPTPEVLRMKYDIVILLCPSEPKIVNGKLTYPELDTDKQTGQDIYLGGQTRMEAAVQIAKQVGVFIVVGGSESKVDGMKRYLEQELGEEAPSIVRIESDPDTLGNLRAVEKQGIDWSDKSIGILTNSYHLPRTMAFAQQVLPAVAFTQIPAESVVEDTSDRYSDAFALRQKREAQGMQNWKEGVYANQRKPESDWRSVCFDSDMLGHVTPEA